MQVLNYFFQLFTGHSKQHAPSSNKRTTSSEQSKLSQLNKVAPLKDMHETQKHVSESSRPAKTQAASPNIVCREAILNKNEKVEAYFFTLTRSANENIRQSSEVIQRFQDECLVNNILKMDIQRLLGHRLAFITISPFSLALPSFKLLPGKGIVIVINAIEALIQKSDESLMQLNALKALGFRIGLQGDVSQPGLEPFINLATFIFMDIGDHDVPDISAAIAAINKQTSKKLFVATNVRLLEEYHVCSKLPFHYFQGTFISNAEKWATPALDASRIKVISLLNLLRQDSDNAELVKTFKLDPTLSFQILRYVNSVGFGLTTKVNSIDQALIVLGRKNLFRWLTLLLFTSNAGNPLDSALMENALVRARLSELCAGESLSPTERDELFIAGVFSLLDVLLRLPIERLLKEVNLPPLVVEALLHQTGKYYPYLDLAIASEEFNQDRIATLADQLGLDLATINSHQIEALLWAQTSNM